MKIRFWQKTYLFTILLFLTCMYIGIFSLAFYTYHRNLENAENACLAEQQYIATSFERDYRDLRETSGTSNPLLLMHSYGSNYEKQQIYLTFSENDKSVYSTFQIEPNTPVIGTISQSRINNVRHILIASEICDGKYTLVYGKSASYIDKEFSTLITTYTLVAFFVSIILAVSLVFLLKRLSTPLEKLQKTTELLAGGNMTVSADESGSDEFTYLAKTFNQMVRTIRSQIDNLSAEAKQKQMLVDNMAHEMRTPLTSIRGYAEYIEKAAVPDIEKLDSARRIMSEADRLKKISEKLLDTAFLREHSIEKKPVDLALLLSNIAQRLSPAANTAGVSIVTDLSDSIVDGDEILLSMLFYNLTENAIKACSQEGTVTLSCDGVLAIVSDNGRGMTCEQLSHITEPFYRTDKSRSRTEGGAGLGLSLCRQIVDSHNARMEFTSEINNGTQVLIQFTTEVLDETGY